MPLPFLKRKRRSSLRLSRPKLKPAERAKAERLKYRSRKKLLPKELRLPAMRDVRGGGVVVDAGEGARGRNLPWCLPIRHQFRLGRRNPRRTLLVLRYQLHRLRNVHALRKELLF